MTPLQQQQHYQPFQILPSRDEGNTTYYQQHQNQAPYCIQTTTEQKAYDLSNNTHSLIQSTNTGIILPKIPADIMKNPTSLFSNNESLSLNSLVQVDVNQVNILRSDNLHNALKKRICADDDDDSHPSSRPFKMARFDIDSLLHNACQLFPRNVAVVSSALETDPDSIHYEVPIRCRDVKSKRFRVPFMKNKTQQQQQQNLFSSSFVTTVDENKAPTIKRENSYKYAVNVALDHDASLDVINLLVKTGPDVLVKPDGPDQCSTLGIALSMATNTNTTSKHNDHNNPTIDEIVKTILKANPMSASVIDKRGNTPLHISIRAQQISLHAIAHIYVAYSEALLHKNILGQTPLDVAIRNSYVSERILDFLHYLKYGNIDQDEVV